MSDHSSNFPATSVELIRSADGLGLLTGAVVDNLRCGAGALSVAVTVRAYCARVSRSRALRVTMVPLGTMAKTPASLPPVMAYSTAPLKPAQTRDSIN